MNSVAHPKTNKVPYEVLFGKKASNVVHIKPFGCRMHYKPNKARLPNFHERAHIVLCVSHEGGGIYHVFAREGVLWTKHTRAEELKFPGFTLFNHKKMKNSSESYKTSGTDEVSLQSSLLTMTTTLATIWFIRLHTSLHIPARTE